LRNPKKMNRSQFLCFATLEHVLGSLSKKVQREEIKIHFKYASAF
jgi:hypothetical protein